MQSAIKIDKTQFKLFLKFLKYLLPYRRKQIAILILSSLGMLLSLVIPYLSKPVVDIAIVGKKLNAFILIGLIGTAVFILNGLINAIAIFLRKNLQLRLDFDLNKKIFGHLQKLPISFFSNTSTGENMFIINYDIENVSNLVISAPEEFIKIFPKIFFILAIIFYLDWRMAVFSFLLVPVFYLPAYYFTRRMRNILQNVVNSSEHIFKRLDEIFSHMYIVKAFGREKTETKNYLKLFISNMRMRLKNARLEVISSLAGVALDRIITGMLVIFGGYLVIKGHMSIGTLVAIMAYVSQLIALQSGAACFFQNVAFGLVSCARLDGVLQAGFQEISLSGSKKILPQNPVITFKAVSFGYRHNEHILKNMDFKIENNFIALVGPSGCGKTTILNLVLKLYDSWEGDIFIGGYNIKELEPLSLREQIGIVLQEPFLWNDSIENNIRYGKLSATREEIIEFARMAGVDDFVKGLPKGYDTVVGENACKLSEGQKQKIAVARALIKKPKILILDEGMSSVDSASEEKILLNIKEKQEDTTVIAVSHRLSTVMAADIVYYFYAPNKMVVESAKNLMNSRDFLDLFAGQYKTYTAGADAQLCETKIS